MGLEIERKFLVHPHLLPKLIDGQRMIQGYLSEKPSVRFRIIDKVMVITVKEYYPGARRFELETPGKKISDEEIQKLQEMAVSPPIIKVRHRIQGDQGLIWEVDVYEGENAGLITVDIEIPREDYPLQFPVWVDGSKEISGSQRYTNLNLGRKPFSQWTNEKQLPN